MKRIVWDSRAARNWKEASISANGVMGVMMMGKRRKETLIGTHCRLYLPLGTREVLPDMRKHIPEFRRLIREEGYRKAYDYYLEQAGAQGFPGLTWTDPFHPAFFLDLQPLSADTGRGAYRRLTDFVSGEVSLSRGDGNHSGRRSLFVSRADNLIYYRIKNPHAGKDLVCRLSLRHMKNDKIRQEFRGTDDCLINQNHYVHGKGGYNVFLKLVQGEGRLGKKNSLEWTIADEGLLLIRIEPFGAGEGGCFPELSGDLSSFTGNYEDGLKAHTLLHGRHMNTVELELDPDKRSHPSARRLIRRTKWTGRISPGLLEQIYNASRFNIISATGMNPPNLQGIWTGSMKPAWSSDFTLDTNLQLAIASFLSSGNSELLLPLFNLMDSMMDDFRENARMLYGCRGILVPCRASNHGMLLHWGAAWPGQFWTCGGGWLAHWYWDYYLYTGDRQFLKERAIPFMVENALFLEDFLVEDGDGRYRFTPSYSAEQPWGSFSTDNSTMDIAVARELLLNLVKACEITGLHKEKKALWCEMEKRLPPYQIHSEEGYLLEWAYQGAPDFPRHRHFSNLYPITYSYEFGPDNQPDLYRASVKSLERRLKHWVYYPFSDKSSHGRMHAALAAAYTGKGQVIQDILKQMIKGDVFFSTLATSHNPHHHVFNLDANGAIPEIIHNCLLFCQDGCIAVLPAPFDALKKGILRGLCLRGGIRVKKFVWDLDRGAGEISLQSDQTVEISFSRQESRTFRAAQIHGNDAGEEGILLESKASVLLNKGVVSRFRLIL